MGRLSSFRAKLFIVIFNFVALFYIVLNRSMTSAPEETVDIVSYGSEKPLPLFDITPFLSGNADVFNKNYGAGKKMFFLVTTGQAEMNAREVCAIESASGLNPSMTIMVVFVLPARQLLLEKNKALAAVLRLRTNVHLATVDAAAAIRSVGLERDIKDDSFSVVHISDVLRLLLVLNLGGVYADLDMVMLKPFSSLVKEDNFVVGASQYKFASCLFGAKPNHALIKKILETEKEEYKSGVYDLGPRAFTMALESYCDKPAWRMLQDRKCTKTDVAIFNQTLIGPYMYTEVNNYFIELNDVQYAKLSRKAVAFHMFNRMSKKKKLAKNSKSVYARAARDFCPISLSTCKNKF